MTSRTVSTCVATTFAFSHDNGIAFDELLFLVIKIHLIPGVSQHLHIKNAQSSTPQFNNMASSDDRRWLVLTVVCAVLSFVLPAFIFHGYIKIRLEKRISADDLFIALAGVSCSSENAYPSSLTPATYILACIYRLPGHRLREWFRCTHRRPTQGVPLDQSTDGTQWRCH